jgi:hypothetical protein
MPDRWGNNESTNDTGGPGHSDGFGLYEHDQRSRYCHTGQNSYRIDITD